MDKLTGRVEALSPEQRALLEARVKRKRLAVQRHSEDSGLPMPARESANTIGTARAGGSSERELEMKFSLYFFSDDGSSSESDKYALLMDCARFADRNGFSAVWTPERHFQRFGGLYPNPSVLGAALAAITDQVEIRAGSVALPLHHPVRVAEEWSVVDNLSHGRVAVSFASGWHPDDFIFAPSVYENRKEIMFAYIEKIQRLWAGEEVSFEGPNDMVVAARILPRPIQSRLPVWITTAGSASTWARAGEIGANVFCALVGYSFDDLAHRIQLYRKSRAEHGFDPRNGLVTVMVHTYIGEDDDAVKAMVRKPMCGYLRSYFEQFNNLVEGSQGITEEDKTAIVSRAFDAYYDESLLIGPMGKCEALVERLVETGVDELACLVDFGLDFDSVIQGLDRLTLLRRSYEPRQRSTAVASSGGDCN